MYSCVHPHEWLPHIRDMLEASESALKHRGDLSESEFYTDQTVFDATVRQITIVGEAANRLPQAVRDIYPSIPWIDIRGARNFLMHQYDDIEPETVWRTVTVSLPQLIPALREILADHKEM